MRILEKTARYTAVVIAVLFIGLSLCGIVGAWYVNWQATDVALKGFGVIEVSVDGHDADLDHCFQRDIGGLPIDVPRADDAAQAQADEQDRDDDGGVASGLFEDARRRATPCMRILEEDRSRDTAVVLAVLFIGLSLCGVLGAWFVHRMATDAALKGFGAIEVGVGVVDAGVARVDDLIARSRTEVRQAAETIRTVGAKALANKPVLNALSARLETSLASRVAQMQQVLAPVRDAVGAVGNAVSMLNSLPIAGRSCSAADGIGRHLQPPRSADRGHDAIARDAAGTGGAERRRRRRDRCRAHGDHATHRHPAGRGAVERSGGAR